MIRWAVARPAAIWAALATVLLSGSIAFTRLSLATKTTVELPRLNVALSWPAASAEIVESYLTSPVEAAVQGVRGVRKVASRSQEGFASITVELQANTSPQLARLAILERLQALRPDFPLGAAPPRVSNFVPDDLQEAPLLRVTMGGPYTPGALQRVADEIVSPRVSAVSGVVGIQTRGGTELGASVSYDPVLLRQLAISPSALEAALGEARVIASLGAERFGAARRAVVLKDQPKTIQGLEQLPIRGAGGRVFALGQLASVRAEEDARGQFFRINGQPAIAFDVTRGAHADAIRTAEAVREALDELRSQLPPGMTFRVVSDDSDALKSQLRDLLIRGAIAFAAVMLVVTMATRNAGAVALVMGSAAASVAGTALGLYVLDIPSNLLTLAGLSMGIGVIVQNGIIVVQRLRDEPDSVDGRARAGARMVPAVVGATLTTVVVLLPFLYLQGDARAAFMPFAIAFVMAMAFSVLASLVGIPALAAGHGHYSRWARGRELYAGIVKRAIRWRWATIVITTGTLVIVAWGFGKNVRRFSFGEFDGDRRSTVDVGLGFPRGSDPEALDRVVREIEAIALTGEGVEQVVAQSFGQASAQIQIVYSSAAGRTALPLQMQESLTQRAVLIGGASVSVSGTGPAFASGFGGAAAGNYRIRVRGYSYEGVTRLALDLKARLERINRVRGVNVNASASFGTDRAFAVTLEPDRGALAAYRLTATDFSQAVQREVRGPVGAQRLDIGNEEIPVTVKARGTRERSMDELAGAIIPTGTGAPVKIGDIGSVGERMVPGLILREDQQYLRLISYEFRGPTKLGDRTHKAFLAAVATPVGYTVEDVSFAGIPTDKSEEGLWIVFGLGLVLVALVVSAVFNSVWATAMVMLDLPIAFGGVMAAFWWTGAAFTREAAVGVILVVGLAVSHSVLLVDAALERRERQHEKKLGGAQVLRTAIDRSGMVVLVTLTTLASLAPLAIGTSANTMFGAIALATAGGTVAGTFGALFVLPALLVSPRRVRAG
jgi:HAE1 family hydrophobic/amphiphilic exporter-1